MGYLTANAYTQAVLSNNLPPTPYKFPYINIYIKHIVHKLH